MLQPLRFAVQSTKDESLPGKDTARLLNMYPEGGENGVTLRSAPGLVEAKDVSPGQIEAMITSTSGIYVVVGGSLKLWNVNDDTLTTLGPVAVGDTTMTRSRSQLAIVAGNRYYVWDGTTLAEVTGTPFALENSVAFISNYFIITEHLGEAFYYSLDADTIGGLSFASAEYYPDNLRRVMVANDLIYFMGTRSIEPWQVTGSANLPFSKIAGAQIEKGLRSTLEAVVMDNTLHWVSQEGRVYRGGQAQNITTDAVAAALEGNTGRMVTYQTRNHDNAVVRLTGCPAFVFDPSTQMWWERSSGVNHDEWDVTATVQHNGVWYAGTRGGKICTFSGFQDLGEELRREAISTNITQGGNRFSVDEVNLRVSGSGSIMLSWSKDGGRTFSNERQRTFGGEFEYPVQINRLGQFREFCLKIACTDNTDFAIHEAGIRIS